MMGIDCTNAAITEEVVPRKKEIAKSERKLSVGMPGGMPHIEFQFANADTISVTDAPFDLDTDAGPHRVQVHAPGPVGDVEVWMRSPSLAPRDLPLTAEAPWRDEPIEVAGERLRVTAVSMGNPHAVTFDPVPRERVGPALEIDARFPERVNVGFVSNIRPGGFDLAVWERGVGFTQACGTGACAAAVAAVETGRAPRGEALRVVLPGGPLLITVGEPDAPVRMRGPAARVFDGVARV